MTERGSAYIFIVVVTMMAAVLLAAALNTTAYEVQVSLSYRNHANLTLLAESGAERMTRLVTAELDAERAEICRGIAAELKPDDIGADIVLEGGRQYLPLYDEKFKDAALAHIRTVFNGRVLEYGITISGAEYAVNVTTEAMADGLAVKSTASRKAQPGTEVLSARLVLGGSDAKTEVVGSPDAGASRVYLTGGADAVKFVLKDTEFSR